MSEDQANLVCAHVDPAHDERVTELARRCTVNQLRRILPTVAPPPPAPGPGPDAEEAAGEEGDDGAGVGDTPGRREVAFGHRDDGRWWARILLPPDEGAVVQTALEAARHALVSARRPATTATRLTTGWDGPTPWCTWPRRPCRARRAPGACPPTASGWSSTSTTPSGPGCTSGRCWAARCGTT